MQIVEKPILPPGECMVTGSGDGPLLDTMRENRDGWRIYVQIAYLREMAGVIGMGTPEAIESLVDENIQLRHDLEAAEVAHQELAELRAALRKTLSAGAVVEKRAIGGGDVTEWSLRPVPGQRKPALEEVADATDGVGGSGGAAADHLPGGATAPT